MKKKLLFLAILLLSSNSITLCQKVEKCNLTKKEAPALWGIKLGMTPEELSRILGVTVQLKDEETEGIYENTNSAGRRVKIRKKVNIGVKGLSILYPNRINEEFKNFDTIFFSFFNNRLYWASIYANQE